MIKVNMVFLRLDNLWRKVHHHIHIYTMHNDSESIGVPKGRSILDLFECYIRPHKLCTVNDLRYKKDELH